VRGLPRDPSDIQVEISGPRSVGVRGRSPFWAKVCMIRRSGGSILCQTRPFRLRLCKPSAELMHSEVSRKMTLAVWPRNCPCSSLLSVLLIFCEEPKREKSDAASDDKGDPAN
jgi:hypothetical protein